MNENEVQSLRATTGSTAPTMPGTTRLRLIETRVTGASVDSMTDVGRAALCSGSRRAVMACQREPLGANSAAPDRQEQGCEDAVATGEFRMGLDIRAVARSIALAECGLPPRDVMTIGNDSTCAREGPPSSRLHAS